MKESEKKEEKENKKIKKLKNGKKRKKKKGKKVTQILFRNHLSHWMLHLQTGIHLHKEKLTRIAVENELNST